MVAPGVTVALVINAIVLVGGGILLLVWRRSRSTDRDPASCDRWYDEAVDILQEVTRVADGSDPGDDREAICHRILPLSTRLKGHARAAPACVENGVPARLHELGTDCYRLGMEHSPVGMQPEIVFEDELNRLGCRAADLKSTLDGH